MDGAGDLRHRRSQGPPWVKEETPANERVSFFVNSCTIQEDLTKNDMTARMDEKIAQEAVSVENEGAGDLSSVQLKIKDTLFPG